MRKAPVLLAVLAAVLGAWLLLRRAEHPDPAPRPAPAAPTPAPAPAPPPAAPPAAVAPPQGTAAVDVLVVDLRGRPLAGASVRIHGPGRPMVNPDMTLLRMEPPKPRAVVREGTCGRDGRFPAAGLEPGTYWARASAPGFATATALAVLREGGEPGSVRLVLEPACSLEGMVRREDGGSTGGWTVVARWAGGWGMLAFDRTESPGVADGRWKVEGLAPGRFEILVRTDGGVLVSAGAVEVPRVRVYDILIRDGATLRGRVVDAATGSPVKGADVLLSLHGGGGFGQSFARGATGEDGVYELAGLPPGTDGWLRVRKEGYLPSFDGGSDPSARIEGLAAGGVFERDVRLARGGRVSGRVVDGAGKPVEGALACVESSTSHGVRTSPIAVAGPDGSFVIDPVQPGSGVLVAWGEGLRQREASAVAVAAGEAIARDVVLDPAPREGDDGPPRPASLAGRVRSDDGSPLVGLRVRVLPDNSNSPYWSLQTGSAVPAGEDGSYRADGLAAGSTAVAAEAEGRALVVGPQVDLSAGEVREGYDIVLPPGLSLAGRVVDGAGNPVEGAGITLDRIAEEHFAAVTGADGAFRVEGLAPGSWTVSAHAPGRDPASATASSGADDVVLVVGETAGLSGTVVDADTGDPVADIEVRDETLMMESMVGGRHRRGGMLRDSAQTDGKGVFRIPGSGPGPRELIVKAEGRNSRGAGGYVPVRVTVDAARGPVRIALHRGLSITGRVVDARGKSLQELIPVAVEEGADDGGDLSGETRHLTTDLDGNFRIQGLPAGTFDLVFFDRHGDEGDGPPAHAVIGVRSGTTDLVVRVTPGLTIEGRVVDERGRPPGVEGYVTPVPPGAGRGTDPWRGVEVAADGSFRTRPVPAGATVELAAGGFHGFLDGRSDPVAAGARDVVVRLRRGGTIAGRVLDEAGEPAAAGVPLVALLQGVAPGHAEGVAYGTSGAGGAFLLEGLPGGVFRIHAGGVGSEFVSSTTVDSFLPGAKDVVIRLVRGLVIAGTVVGKPEFPFLDAVQGNHRFRIHLGEDGTFTVKGLGKGRVTFHPMGGEEVLAEVDPPAAGVEIRVP